MVSACRNYASDLAGKNKWGLNTRFRIFFLRLDTLPRLVIGQTTTSLFCARCSLTFAHFFLVTFTLTAVDPAYAQAELSPAQLDAALSATYLDGPSGMLSLDEAAALRAQEASAANIGLGALYGLLLAIML